MKRIVLLACILCSMGMGYAQKLTHPDLLYTPERIEQVKQRIGQDEQMASAWKEIKQTAEKELKRQFREREPKKQYQAVVWGHLEQDSGIVDLPLICDWENRPRQRIDFLVGKKAQTQYQVLARYPNNTTRVKLTPITGRSHQLRVHMLALGHPILGDKFYSPPAVRTMATRLCLHAESLTITHPITQERMTFTCPPDF